jgi:DNA-binding NarL/FixJ family response regulator
VAVRSPDPLARAGLEAALEASTAVALLAPGAGPGEEPEVVLWDAGSDATPYLDGLRDSKLPTLVMVSDAGHADRALAAGARGVIQRDRLGPSLLAALDAVRLGLTVLDADAHLPAPRPHAPENLLTPREGQVLSLMATGLSNKLIAADLGISEHTAKFHVNGVLHKLDADTRTGAVMTGVRLGLISL